MKKKVDFGLAVPVGPQKDDYKHWLTDVETSAQLLQGHFRSLWFYDHFFYDEAPAFEA